MILPVTAYGHPTLRKKAEDIDQNYENLDQLIENMFETMHYANGIGLAAPQVNLPIRLFLIDATPYEKDIPEAKDFKKVFINAEIVDKRGEELNMEEGCLSIPGIHEEVTRPGGVHIKYYDENWNFHDEKYSGMIARIIQHEYDHIEGILFPDRLSTLRKTLIRGKLKDIAYGKVDPGYKMVYPSLKKKKTAK